jgi:hypothetical protein
METTKKMKFINTFKSLKRLKRGTKLNRIKDGDIEFYHVIGHMPRVSSGFMMVSNSKKIVYIYEQDFKPRQFSKDYNAKEVGEIMISQIKEWSEKEIENITAVYLKDIQYGNKQK